MCAFPNMRSIALIVQLCNRRNFKRMTMKQQVKAERPGSRKEEPGRKHCVLPVFLLSILSYFLKTYSASNKDTLESKRTASYFLHLGC